ncbi:putative ribonuclease H-like domain-containing protein [Tanacetum coccineum]
MTGNKSYLLDYEEIIGGFVAFGGDLKGGRITGKGKISTCKLDFEDVYFVKELKFNLFSVSQMYDKKNSVLFTDTECVVLSHDFKLLDENHVLLRVPRKDNMYSVDLKNIVPSGGFSYAGFKPSGEEEKMDSKHLENKDSEVPNTKEPRVHQEQDANVNSTNNINTVIPIVNVADIENNVVDENIVYGVIDIQIDVKSAFLYGTIEEEVYVCQPLGFEDPEFPNKVYKVEKALYGLHQAPIAWVAASIPIETNKALLKDEEAVDVDVHLYRSMIGSLMYLTASRPDIMFSVCACARFQVTLKTSHLHVVKRIFRYLKGHPKLGLWYPRDSPVNLEAFSDSDYAGASLDRKSTTRGYQFLRRRQVLWIQNQLLDYGYNFMNTKIFIDNESTIYIVKNLVFHSKTKLIEIRHHFIRVYRDRGLIQVIKIQTDHNVADLLTKAFDVSRFQHLIAKVTLINETQEIYDEEMLFDIQDDLQGEEVVAEKEVVEKEVSVADPVTTAGEVVTTDGKTKAEGSSKRAGNELEQEKAKKQKGDDQEEAEMKRHIEIVKDDEVAIDAIPLATKPPMIVDYKIDKDGRMGYFKLIRADGSSKRYSSMIKMLQGINREDLETIWKLVKSKYENTRPEDDYERVL